MKDKITTGEALKGSYTFQKPDPFSPPDAEPLTRTVAEALGEADWKTIKANEAAKDDVRNCQVKEVTIGEAGLMAMALELPIGQVVYRLINYSANEK